MSNDFPDGPDYNPEVIEDDPWDEPQPPEDPPEATGASESDEDA